MSNAEMVDNDNMNARKMIYGVLIGLLGYTIIPIGDGIAKYLAVDGYSGIQVTWGRYMSHVIVVLPFVLWRLGPKGMIPKDFKFQVMRSLLLVFSTMMFFSSLAFIQLADALAVVFVAPLILTALSGPVLGEQVGMHRWAAVLVGFVGALIIIQPGAGVFNGGALLALGAGTFFGGYLLVTKKGAGRNHPLTTTFFMGVVGVIVLSGIVLFFWKPLDSNAILLMLGIGITAGAGHGLLIAAAQYIEANLMAPIQYFELLVGAVFGYIVFNDIPTETTWIGASIVIASGLYIAYRERVRAIKYRRGLESL